MTTAQAVNHFASQPSASLNNALSRGYLAELLNDPVNALAALRRYSPLRQSNPGQYAALQRVTSVYLDILSRLPINWYNPLETYYLNTASNNILASSYQGAVEDCAPLLWYRFDESASPAVNYGALGTGENGTVTNATFQLSGPNNRVPYSYNYDGATTQLAVPSNAGLNSADYTMACLVNLNSAGEASLGLFLDGYVNPTTIAWQIFFVGSMNVIRASIRNTADTQFATNTTTGISASTWTWLFAQYNDTTKMGRLWKGINGALTEFGYSAPAALTGTARQIGQAWVGSAKGGTNTHDGKFAQLMLFNTLLTTTQMQNIVTASGV